MKRQRSARIAGPAFAALLLVSCSRPAPLPTYGAIPEFELIAQTGQPFDSHSLDGHIWVANFVYTTCPGPCPMMSHQMLGIQTGTVKIHLKHIFEKTGVRGRYGLAFTELQGKGSIHASAPSQFTA